MSDEDGVGKGAKLIIKRASLLPIFELIRTCGLKYGNITRPRERSLGLLFLGGF